MSFLKPKYSSEQKKAIQKGAERGSKVLVGGMAGATKKVIPKAFKIAGQTKPVKVVNGWVNRGSRVLTNKVRGSWK